MRRNGFFTAFIVVLSLATAGATDIEGTIIVKHKLTKRKVTATALAYERGAAVELRADRDLDPLVFERLRVVVYLEGQFPHEPVTAVLEQKNRRFIPETLVVPAGSTVSFPNLDPLFHNVFSLSNPKTFDLGNYSKDHTRTVTFPKPGIVFVNCHLHPNMAAAIVISPNQWSAKADSAGRFTLPGVPPGIYTIVAWHRAAGFFRQTVKVTENRASDVQFVIPIDADGLTVVEARR
jgi:plastocyanin